MASDLRLERNMQEQYTRVQIADMMEDEFPDDAGLDKLIRFCEDLPALRRRAAILKKERSEAQKRKSMNKEETGGKKTKESKEQDQPPYSEETTARCQSPIPQISSSASSIIPLAKNQNSQPQNLNIARGAVLQREPLTVMVLKATDPFEYGTPEHGVKNMFHATVATVNQYFHVKVFNIYLKEKFTKNNFIIISNYLENKGILEINEASSVLEAAPDQKIEVPNLIIRNSNKTPEICDIKKGAAGAVCYGLFTLHKKKVNPTNTIYEMKDVSGSIEVVGNGKWYNINCKEGDKFRLFCFHLKTINRQPKLVCGEHSFIKGTKK
ncbi:Interferon-activable protein 205-A [Apodemus speciosus]|uniref:Interferon-activable protein 205-A n=1 Tax=Apodemus speciosus TaxID=105296 RepID=A0ABQ0EFM7_APOSI